MRRLAACLFSLVLAAPPLAAQTDMPTQSPTLLVPLEDCPIPPAAPLPDPVLLPDGLIDALLDWIAAATAYDVDMVRADPPEITFCATGDLIEYEDMAVHVGSDLHGLYDNVFQRIVLVRPWSADAPRDRALLLHELTHRVQMANRGWDCPQAPEWEAYQLQAQYLAEHQIESGFDWMYIYMLSRCPNDVHPAEGR
jgi:hypothetical protein